MYISRIFLKLTVKADDIPNDRMTIKTFAMTKVGTTEISTEAEMEIIELPTEAETAELLTEMETTEPSTEAKTVELLTEMETTELPTEAETVELLTKIETIEQNDSNELQTEKAEELSEVELRIVDEVPMFEACLEYTPQGWIVKGIYKDFSPDTILVQPMCSTDGESYRECGQEWNLQWLGSENEAERKALQNQRCLYDSEEPLKSYLAKERNCFYIKLRIVREGGIIYETQAAIIER